MTTKVFVAGSMNIKHLAPQFKERLDNVLESGFEVLVGDADGADTSIQQHVLERGASNIRVFCSGPAPRNNVGDWPVESVATQHAEGSRAFFTAKDLRMAALADFGLMIWDAKSTGTLSNVLELLARRKKSVVFVNKAKIFRNVGTAEQLEELLSFMSVAAKDKADQKMNLSARVRSLKYVDVQGKMF